MSAKSNVQFTIYNHESGVNAWKILFVLVELGLSYDECLLDFAKQEQKGESYVQMVPNGRIPAIKDYWNSGKVIWESNAVLKYLAERYDTERKFLVDNPDEKTDLDTWLFFQSSHQGPYFGQLQWFSFYHQEEVPSAIARYTAETKRILGVLDRHLTNQEWLVGGKCTLADLAFVKYNEYAIRYLLCDGFDFQKEFPNVYRWHQSLMARPAIEWVFYYKEVQNLGRERQHVTGETYSSFAARAKGLVKYAVPVVTYSSPFVEVAAN